MGTFHIFGIAPDVLGGPILQCQKNGTHPYPVESSLLLRKVCLHKYSPIVVNPGRDNEQLTS